MSDETQMNGAQPGEARPSSERVEDPQTSPSGDGGSPSDQRLNEPKREAGDDNSPRPFDTSLLETGGEDPTPGAKQPEPKHPNTPPHESPRLSQAQRQVESWYDRVASGQTTLDDDKMPEWVRDNVKRRIDMELDGEVYTPTPSGDPKREEPGAVDETKLSQKILDQTRFDRLIESLPEMPTSMQKALASEAKRLESLGLKRLDAWNEAVRTQQIREKAEEMGTRSAYMSVPGGGNTRGDRGTREEVTKSQKSLGKRMGLSEEDYKKYGPNGK